VLAAQNRLRRREDFARVYAKGRQYNSSHLKLRIYRTGSSDLQVGIVVSKKVSKKAVVRNLIKRQLRAIFRICLPQLQPGLQIVVTVFIKPQEVIPGYKQFEAELTKLLNRACHGN
jgi:ribonuclease P protein component